MTLYASCQNLNFIVLSGLFDPECSAVQSSVLLAGTPGANLRQVCMGAIQKDSFLTVFKTREPGLKGEQDNVCRVCVFAV